jgi:hypothetical protein
MSIADLPRVYPLAQLLVFLRHKGITARHIAFGAGVLFFLWASYHTFFSPQSLSFPSEIYVAPATPTTPEEWRYRAEQVKAAFIHAYHGYELHAWKSDELRPMSSTAQNKYDLIDYIWSLTTERNQLQWMGRDCHRLVRYNVSYGFT